MPLMMRFPGKIAAGPDSSAVVSHQDWFPTILAVADDPDIGEKLKMGLTIGKMTEAPRGPFSCETRRNALPGCVQAAWVAQRNTSFVIYTAKRRFPRLRRDRSPEQVSCCHCPPNLR